MANVTSTITSTVTRGSTAATPPDMQNMDAWTVQLRYQGRRMTVPFYMGYGHSGKQPTTVDVLETLIADATTYENSGDLESFMREYGYESKRDARQVFRGVERNTLKLRNFLGADYDVAVFWRPETWVAEHTE